MVNFNNCKECKHCDVCGKRVKYEETIASNKKVYTETKDIVMNIDCVHYDPFTVNLKELQVPTFDV